MVTNRIGPPVQGSDFFDRDGERRRAWDFLHRDHLLLLAPRRGDSHTRWIASDGTLRRSYVHVFPERALASEIAEGGFRELAPPLPGHREIVPR